MSRRTMLRIFTLLTICFVHINISLCLDVEVTSKPVSCNGGNNGEITAKIINSSNDYTLRLVYAKNNKKVKQMTFYEDTSFTFKNLESNNYKIIIVESGIVTKQDVVLEEVKSLSESTIIVNQYPSSQEANDGIIEVLTKGGTPPYTYKWSENAKEQTTRLAKSLKYGTYVCLINDKNNCGPVSTTIFLYPKNKQKSSKTE